MKSFARSMLTPALVAGIAISLAACGDDHPTQVIPPGDADLAVDITTSRTLYADTVYTLTSYVHVTNGATLTIQPGTVIQGQQFSALFITRGARIVANGTADRPIVFTSDQPVGSRTPGDWGGLIIIGNGIINRSGNPKIEGTGSGTAANVEQFYGNGSSNTDSSGVLRYVRIEFAGFGAENNQELNSLTLAAVGSRTKVEYVQALAGLDDSFEWFGGAVDGRYLVSYESGDDHFDASEGYVGRNQFLIAFQDSLLPPRGGSGVSSSDPQGFEVDGCDGSGCDLGRNSTPLTIPMFANFTVVGTGNTVQLEGKPNGGIGMMLRRGAGGYYVNGIVARWPRAGISLRDTETQTRFADGDLILRNISVIEVGTAGTNTPVLQTGTECPATNCQFSIDLTGNAIVAEAGTVTAASVFAGLPAAPTTASLDLSLADGAAPRAAGTGVFAAGPLLTKGGTFVLGTSYRGAWNPAAGAPGKWWDGWTVFRQN